MEGGGGSAPMNAIARVLYLLFFGRSLIRRGSRNASAREGRAYPPVF
jgi:hypothetical protein